MSAETKPLLLFNYNRSKIRKAILIFQGCLLILIYWSIGVIHQNTKPDTMNEQIIILLFGFVFYFAMMAMLLRIYNVMEFLRIYKNGNLKILTTFSVESHVLPSGSRVNYSNREVEIETDLPRIASFRANEGLITIRLPNGLETISEGAFVIDDEGKQDAR